MDREEFMNYCRERYLEGSKNSLTLSRKRLDAIKAYLKNDMTAVARYLCGTDSASPDDVQKGRLAKFRHTVSSVILTCMQIACCIAGVGVTE